MPFFYVLLTDYSKKGKIKISVSFCLIYAGKHQNAEKVVPVGKKSESIYVKAQMKISGEKIQ